MRLIRNYKLPVCAVLAAAGLFLNNRVLIAQQEPLGDIQQLDPVLVIGSKDELQSLPGSAYLLDPVVLESFQYQDINDVLSRVPGVYVREEDGFGLFPNISLRGADPGRSGKVTLMEDSIPIAPAPYSAPSAYYSPTLGRMSGIEVLKGSSQIRFGPHTTGGVINYLSTPIPSSNDSTLKASYGNFGQRRIHLWNGGSLGGAESAFAYLAEVHHEGADGFREIQPAAAGGYPGSDDTGYNRTDSTVKLAWRPNSAHSTQLKLGYTQLHSNTSYLGLNEGDFASSPYDRYAASRLDEIHAHHSRILLTHTWRVSDHYRTAVKAYRNRFHRNWYKLDKVNGSSPASAILEHSPHYATVIGAAEGELKIKGNNRDYLNTGIQWLHNLEFSQGDWYHELEAGLILHSDSIRRYQYADYYGQDASGALTGIVRSTGPDREGNRKQSSVAKTFYIVDSMLFGDWKLVPGIRYEHIDWDYYRADSRDPAVREEGNYSIFVPGISVHHQSTDSIGWFAGLHRGVSPISPGAASSGLEEETSNSLEVGIRVDERVFNAEMVAFYTRFENLITAESVATGGDDANIGEVDVRGVEWMLNIDLLERLQPGSDHELLLEWSGTYTHAEIVDPTDGQTDPESIFFGAFDGSRVPYIPRWMQTVGLHYRTDRWSVGLSAGYVGEVFGTADNRESSSDDIRVGKLDSRWVLDASVHYQVREDLEAFLVIGNLLDEVYIASRLPHGLRAGMPQSVKIGFTWSR